MAPEHAERLSGLIKRFHDKWPNEEVQYGKRVQRGGAPVNGLSFNSSTKKYEPNVFYPAGFDSFFLKAWNAIEDEWSYEYYGADFIEAMDKFDKWLAERDA